MSYKALYRIYRPKSFEEFVGQRHIVQTLKNAANNNKIAHAYLFTGPRGTGKTSMAKLFAKTINCESDVIRPCNECENCIANNNSNHPDIIEIDGASNNGVDEIRNLIEKVRYSPIVAKYKVYIIDEVHMLSTGAFNAFLKTLEEPPSHVVFILATTEPHKIIPTIISRCQRFDFGKINKKDIEEKIIEILNLEEVKFEEEATELISELADGSMRDALSILDQTLAYSGGELKIQHVRDIYGVISNKNKLDLLSFALSKDNAMILKTIDELDNKGIDFYRLTSDLIDILKEILIYKSSLNHKVLKLMNKDQALHYSENISSDDIFSLIDILMQTLTNFKKVNSPRTFLELAFLKMCHTLEHTNKNQTKEIVKIRTIEIEKEEKYEEKEIKEEIVIKEPKEDLTNLEETKKTINVEEKEIEEVNSEPLEIEKEEKFRPSEDELLNVLVQANRDSLIKAKQKWVVLPKYMNSNTSAQVCSMLLDAIPVAASDDAIILAYKNDVYLDNVNSISKYKIINSFLKAFYDRDILCYCITREDFTTLKKEYMILRKKNSLPEPKEILFSKKHTNNTTIEKNEAIKYGEKVFGDKLEIKEE